MVVLIIMILIMMMIIIRFLSKNIGHFKCHRITMKWLKDEDKILIYRAKAAGAKA